MAQRSLMNYVGLHRPPAGCRLNRHREPVVVGGMLIGPIIMLVVVPALQTLFLTRRETEAEASTRT
jgi:hypothetical protein